MNRWLVFMGALLVAAGVQAATLYRWVAPNGSVTYQNTPPPASAGHVQVMHLGGHPHPGALRAALSALHPVVLYKAPHCQPCRQASAYLRGRKVPFHAIDVSRNQSALRAMKEKTGSTTVPTIMVGHHALVGFVPSVLREELTAAGYLSSPSH